MNCTLLHERENSAGIPRTRRRVVCRPPSLGDIHWRMDQEIPMPRTGIAPCGVDRLRDGGDVGTASGPVGCRPDSPITRDPYGWLAVPPRTSSSTGQGGQAPGTPAGFSRFPRSIQRAEQSTAVAAQPCRARRLSDCSGPAGPRLSSHSEASEPGLGRVALHSGRETLAASTPRWWSAPRGDRVPDHLGTARLRPPPFGRGPWSAVDPLRRTPRQRGSGRHPDTRGDRR